MTTSQLALSYKPLVLIRGKLTTCSFSTGYPQFLLMNGGKVPFSEVGNLSTHLSIPDLIHSYSHQRAFDEDKGKTDYTGLRAGFAPSLSTYPLLSQLPVDNF